jgi:hypothetical protein
MTQLEMFGGESLSPSGEDGAKRQVRVRQEKAAPEWREWTLLEHSAAHYLASVTYPVGTGAKRLARSLAHRSINGQPISEKQALAMWALVWRFRRQIASQALVEHARRLVVPNVEGAFLQ